MSQRDQGRRTALQVKFNNVDITEDITENLLSLTYTDATEGETDDLKIVIHDRDSKWVRDWLTREMESRDSANGDIARGSETAGGSTGTGQTYTVNAQIGLNVRSGRGTGYEKLGTLAYGTSVTVSEVQEGWATITYEGKTAYVYASYLTPSGGSGGGGQSYTVNAKIGLNVRAGRGTGYQKLGTLAYGTSVTVSEIQEGWATISYSGQTAYVYAAYLTANGSGGGGSQSYTVNAQIGLNVRAGRGTGYEKLGTLPYGTEVTASEIQDGWATITYNGQTAYVCAYYLTPAASDAGDSGSGGEPDGSGTANAKYTKINAVITAMNVDGNGTDKVLDCGRFELDSVRFSTPPNRLEMSATSLSYESCLRKTKKTRGYSGAYLRDIAGGIAEAGGYDLMYVSGFNPYYSYILQDDVSDIEFLHQRCEAAGLRLKITDGIIVVYDSGENDNRDAEITITMGDGSYESISLESTLAMTAYSSCHVSYEDDSGNTYEATFTPPTGYSEGEVLEVKEQVGSNEEAMELAIRRLRKANKGEITGKIKMPGNPDMVAGINILLSGFGDFDGKYSVDKSTHKIPPYTTDIEISKVVEGY